MPGVDREHTTHYESCGCAEAKVKRLGARVAELEAALADPLAAMERLATRYGWLAVQISGIDAPEAQLEVAWDTEVYEYLGGPSHPMAGVDLTRAEALALLAGEGSEGGHHE